MFSFMFVSVDASPSVRITCIIINEFCMTNIYFPTNWTE
uniref:Uncharacterized protein n=1 Tax=Arundo donax TaxID=35708 RepID=A0A0A9E7H7_ARUDO